MEQSPVSRSNGSPPACWEPVCKHGEIHQYCYTVKYTYSKHSHNELTLNTAKWFSIPVTLLHVVNITVITNNIYNGAMLINLP